MVTLFLTPLYLFGIVFLYKVCREMGIRRAWIALSGCALTVVALALLGSSRNDRHH